MKCLQGTCNLNMVVDGRLVCGVSEKDRSKENCPRMNAFSESTVAVGLGRSEPKDVKVDFSIILSQRSGACLWCKWSPEVCMFCKRSHETS